jgi:hypothetical protein
LDGTAHDLRTAKTAFVRRKFGNKIARIVSVDADSYSVRLRFADGFVGTVRLGHMFVLPKGLVAEVARGGLFARCYVESGALAWPNGLEFCPDAIRRWIDEQANQRAA